MKRYSETLIENWLKNQQNDIDAFYEKYPERKPKMYESQHEVFMHLQNKAELLINSLKIENNRSTLRIKDVVQLLLDNVAIINTSASHTQNSIAFYNYDTHVYEYSTHILNQYIVAILKESNRNILNSVILTLQGYYHKFALYNPLPSYKVAVGNGIYNCLTKKLEQFDPKYSVLTKIQTNYNPNSQHPIFNDGFTFDEMKKQLSNYSEDRERLLNQILKSIITGNTSIDAFFIFIGRGGDGKSTMFELVINVIGRENVGFVNFNEITQSDKMLETINKKLVIGMDNDVNVYIKNTYLIKSIASHETMTYSQKYLPAISVPFTGVFVQLCNDAPRFAETGSSIERRYVTFESKNSHYLNDTINTNIKQHIKNQQLHEYVLKSILESCYYSDFNDVDKESTKMALTSEDPLYQFCEDLYHNNILISINKKIPANILYGVYQQWTQTYNYGSKTLTYKSFLNKIALYLEQYGFNCSSTQERKRVTTLLNNNQFIIDLLGSYNDSKFVQDALANNNTLHRYIYFDETIDLSKLKSKKRKDVEVSAVEYFKLDTELYQFAVEKDLLDEITEIENTYEQEYQTIDSIRIPNILECESYEDVISYLNLDVDRDLTIQLLKYKVSTQTKNPHTMLQLNSIDSDEKYIEFMTQYADSFKNK